MFTQTSNTIELLWIYVLYTNIKLFIGTLCVCVFIHFITIYNIYISKMSRYSHDFTLAWLRLHCPGVYDVSLTVALILER